MKTSIATMSVAEFPIVQRIFLFQQIRPENGVTFEVIILRGSRFNQFLTIRLGRAGALVRRPVEGELKVVPEIVAIAVETLSVVLVVVGVVLKLNHVTLMAVRALYPGGEVLIMVKV